MPQADPTLRRQRRHLHFDALVGLVRQRFEGLPEPRRDPDFSLADTLMAGLALFSLKDPSLLAFMHRAVDHNLRRVFGLQAVPSDTQRCGPSSTTSTPTASARPSGMSSASCSAARSWSRMSSSKAATWWRWTASNTSGPRRSTATTA